MVIGIGGSSNSGKSHLAEELVENFGAEDTIHLCQDDFVFSTNKIRKINGHTDWEQAETIDIERYVKTIKDADLKYKYVISEGIFAFHFPELNKLYSQKIYLEIDKNTFILRKLKDYRWGKEPDWYINHIWNSHIANIEYKDLSNVTFIDANKKAEVSEALAAIEELTIQEQG